ncbi:MAG: tyrosine-type recombinase/integrase [Verrucomicrobia bacterium]|nr:tyrosine-type recombinase/integrase [Verrucomicrobiota bacterium]
MGKAGVVRGEGRIHEKGKAGRSVYSRSFHSLRHTFNSWMLNVGVSQETRQQLVGHADKETNTRYSHHQLDTLRAAVDAVPGFTKKRKKKKKRSRKG